MVGLLMSGPGAPSAGYSEELAGDELSRAAQSVLKSYCYSCHGVDFKVPRLDIMNHRLLVQSRPEQESFIVPGNPDESLIWNRMGIQQDMPPEDATRRPSEQELEIVRKWIEAGAAEPTDPSRQFLEEREVLSQIQQHLQRMRSQDRPHQRYLTLTNLHNNPTVSAADLRLYRAAFSKLINSLSRRGTLVIPELIDASKDSPGNGVIFHIDLRQLGWDTATWQQAIQNYPYGVKWRDPELDELDADINRMLGGDINGDGVSSVRVDWFIHTASRPPVYHRFLDIPQTIQELEVNRLGVNVTDDFRNGQLLRAGFSGSGVSRNNRLVDRHGGSNTKYYYRSYDFAKSVGRGVLSRFPLGPNFEGNPFPDFAFEHDGGEIIYSMPNGMQGYMLIDGAGNRLDDAPINLVRDINESSGNPVIVNGISCIGCHKRGLIDYEDAVRAAKVLGGDALTKVDSIYARGETLQDNLDNDRQLFLLALRRIMTPFLVEGEDYGSNLPVARIEDLPEPVSTVSRWYDKDVGPAEAAAELNLKSAEYFQAAVGTNDKLRQLGVGPLGEGARIPRAVWDSLDESTSTVFQRIFVSLGFGTAVSPISQ
jgi:serine/threonine-protein kinase